MNPYELAQQQGQVLGGPAPDDEAAGTDLLDLLTNAFAAAGHADDLTHEQSEAVGRFAGFANDYLSRHRVISTGVVDGEFSLVFEGGRTVPLATAAQVAPPRPESTVAITTPRDAKMKGMAVVDTSVPITTGRVGTPGGR